MINLGGNETRPVILTFDKKKLDLNLTLKNISSCELIIFEFFFQKKAESVSNHANNCDLKQNLITQPSYTITDA